MKRFILFLFLGYWIAACQSDECYLSSVSSFNTDWKFFRQNDTLISLDSCMINGVAWGQMEDVTLPHTAHIEPLTVNHQWQGICYYAKKFQLSDFQKIHSIYFEGAMNKADVWLNGRHIGSHLGGFLPFSVQLDNLCDNDSNLLVVKLDNRDNAITGPKPLKFLDFCTYGGIYRNVWLVSKDSIYISNANQANQVAGGGIFVHSENISEKQAKVFVQTHLMNESNHDSNIQLLYHIQNKDGKSIVHEQTIIEVTKHSDCTYRNSFTIKTPDLWSITNPNMYTLTVSLLKEGNVIDKQNVSFGIRDIKITPDGLKLNGQKCFLRGVNRHQEYPYVGYALSDEAQRRDARKIKAAGFDYVRLCHYPQSTAFLDECDKLGLLVLDAILGWQYFGDSQFAAHTEQSARQLIRRDRNHPCILAWELSINETQMPQSFMTAVNKIAHEEYPFADCYTAGWIKGNYDIYIEARQHRHDIDYKHPLLISEYGDWEYYAQNAGFNQNDWNNLLPDERSSRQARFSGEKRLLQQTINIEEAHNDNLMTHAFADGYWAMFDYNRGYANDIEYSGIMDICRLPKFAYHFFRSQRSEEPEIFVASYWQPGISRGVRVFSNCELVKLYVDDQFVAEQSPDIRNTSNRLSHPPFSFDIDCRNAGSVKAVGYINNQAVVEHLVRTPETPQYINLQIDDEGIAPTDNDVLLVHAAICDANNTIVPTANNEITFNIEGAMLLSPATVNAEAGIATAVIRTLPGNKIVNISASDNHISSTILTFKIYK